MPTHSQDERLTTDCIERCHITAGVTLMMRKQQASAAVKALHACWLSELTMPSVTVIQSTQSFAVLPAIIVDDLEESRCPAAWLRRSCFGQYMKPLVWTHQKLLLSRYVLEHTSSLCRILTSFQGHGTGTAAGDPIEAGAFTNVLAKHRTAANPIYLGSVKSNFG